MLGGVAAFGASSASATTALTTFALAAPGTPSTIIPGASNQAGTSWTMTLPNTFANGDIIQLQVAPSTAAHQCSVTGDYIGFSNVPTITVASNGTTETAPTFAAPTLAASTAAGATQCTAAGIQDLVNLQLTDAASTGATSWTVTISNVKYTTGPAIDTGAVTTTGNQKDATATSFTAGAYTVPSNATVANLAVTGNSPAVGLVPTGGAQNVGNVVITE
ncbi:MAG TPA: hypothetical protein VE991_01945, partial [Acidimicrobiales bacterium]|nr:hypothetical protein [Acidimicrobiales bacterium]